MDNENQLLEFLNSNGFKGQKLEADIKRQLELFSPTFKVLHEMQFGENTVTYEMDFIYDRQFSAYRLESYLATLTKTVTINHKIVDEINTAVLERTIEKIDWQKYFYEKHTLSDSERISAEQALNQLDHLAEIPDIDANRISEKLQFKYFPPEIYAEIAIEDYSKPNQHYREYIADEFGIPSAFLAYHSLSGNLDNLCRSLRDIGMDDFTYTDTQSLLTSYLSGNPDKFTIYGSKHTDKGIVDIQMEFTKDGASYQAETFDITFSPYINITHLKTPDIDTLLLEEQIKMVNWQKDKLINVENDEFYLLPHINNIKEKVDLLSTYPGGEEIADYLKMRYWSNSGGMEIYMDEPTLERWNNQHKIRQRFSADVNIAKAINLMDGKPALAEPLEKVGQSFDQWFIIDPTSVAAKGLNPLELVKGLSIKEAEIMLRMLPLAGSTDVSLALNLLSQGERLKVDLIGLDGDQVVYMEANPREKIIDIFTEEGLKIPMNYRLDPNWQVSQNATIEIQEVQKEQIQNSPQKRIVGQKRKNGRGI